jgi:hypothetical protein
LLLLDAEKDGPKLIVSKVAEAIETTKRGFEKLKKQFFKEGFHASIEHKNRVKPPREI